MKTIIFEKMGNVVNRFLDKRTKEELFFSKKFNNFFVLEDYLFCVKMIEEGYVATQLEQNKLNKLILIKIKQGQCQYNDIRQYVSLNETIKLEGLLKAVPMLHMLSSNIYDSTLNYSGIEKLLTTKNKLNQEDFILGELHNDKNKVLEITKTFIQNYKSFYKRGMDLHGDFCKQPEDIVEQQRIKLEKLVYLNILMIKNGLYNSEEINDIKDRFKKISRYFEWKTSKSYSQSSYRRCNKLLWDSFSEGLNKYLHMQDDNNKDELLRQLKSYSLRKKSLSEEVKSLIVQEDYSLDKLPADTKEKIQNIENIAKELNSQEVNDFIQQRLPVILKKYFSIDQEYRTELKNIEGFNAEELMNQSLDNIERIVKSKQQDNNYDLLSELSIENRKLKMHKVV